MRALSDSWSEGKPCQERYGRREFFARAFAGGALVTANPDRARSITVSVNLMLDQGAHSGRGLGEVEVARFQRLQERARREYATSGISFDLRPTAGAFLRTQGYSEIPSKFLQLNRINLFVTTTLGYDIDRDRTGGCAIGPRPRGPNSAPDPFYKIFLGLQQANETTLVHEYAHHFTLDTKRYPSASGNFWADLRNDYWLWWQRRGVSIQAFRTCTSARWARLEGAT